MKFYHLSLLLAISYLLINCTDDIIPKDLINKDGGIDSGIQDGSTNMSDSSIDLVCPLNYLDCDNDINNGCEINISTNVSHCGKCQNGCKLDEKCNKGECIYFCNETEADCDKNFSNGCEINVLKDNLNCGGCGNVCFKGQTCSFGKCQCNGAANFANCDEDLNNGCEINIHQDINNCGKCDYKCPYLGAICNVGNCEYQNLTCDQSVGGAKLTDNCDNFEPNGCETDLIDNNNCGGCNKICIGNCYYYDLLGEIRCDCPDPLFDCDENITCETDLSTSPNNCGFCGNTCINQQICVNGFCVDP